MARWIPHRNGTFSGEVGWRRRYGCHVSRHDSRHGKHGWMATTDVCVRSFICCDGGASLFHRRAGNDQGSVVGVAFCVWRRSRRAGCVGNCSLRGCWETVGHHDIVSSEQLRLLHLGMILLTVSWLHSLNCPEKRTSRSSTAEVLVGEQGGAVCGRGCGVVVWVS